MLIENRKPKTNTKDSGYFRLLNHEALAELIQKVQSCVIGNGNELEEKVYNHSIATRKFRKQKLLEFNLDTSYAFVIQMKVPTPKDPKKKNIAVDCMIIQGDEIYVIELKDGCNFDTKKSAGEVESLKKACAIISSHDPRQRRCIPKIVFWNAKDLNEVSFKSKDGQDMLMVGSDFSSKFGVNFDQINVERGVDAAKNLAYIKQQLKEIL